MNVLRELRKFKTKSAIAKLRMLVLLIVMLVGSSYAWFNNQLDVGLANIRGKVVPWDIEYSIDDETIQEREITITVDEFYPGMEEFEKNIMIKNLTNTSSIIEYELISVRLFGEEILEELNSTNNIVDVGTTKNIFVTEEYPFNLGYHYDKDELNGEFVDETTTENSFAQLRVFANWSYEREGANKTYEENDVLDTWYGEKAYEYYDSELSKQYSPIEIVIKITSSRLGWADVN